MSQLISFPDGYIHITPSGLLNEESLNQMAENVSNMGNSCRRTPHRLIDLTEVTSIEIGFSHLWSLAQRCKMHPPRNPVKCAIVASVPVHLGYARMYQRINDHPGISIAIFNEVAHAREWLFSAQDLDPELAGVVAARERAPVPELPAPAEAVELNAVLYRGE